MALSLLQLLILLSLPGLVSSVAESVGLQTYTVPEELRKLAAPYKGDAWDLPGVSDDDRLVFADIIASARADVLKREKQTDDYEFGLAAGCFPIPNWPKPPPPPPPKPAPKPAPKAALVMQQAVSLSLQVPPSSTPDALSQRIHSLMVGIATDTEKQLQLRRSLNPKILVLGPGELRERGIFVTDVFAGF